MKLSEEKMKAGWQIVRFGDVAKEVRTTTKDPLADGLEYYVGLEHLDPQSLRIQRKGLLAEDNPTFTLRFKPGQILFGKRRAYQKKAAIADFEGVCSGDIIVMEEKPGKIIPGLLPFIVQSDMFFDYAVKTSSGSLSPRTKWKTLADFEFPLPPPDRQKAILEVLQKVEEVVGCNSLAVDLAHRFMVSSLRRFFEKSDGMKTISLFDLAHIKGGRQRAPKYDTGKMSTKYLRPANIKRGRIKWDDILSMDFTEEEKAVYQLLKGDLLLVEGGEAEDVGDPVYFEESKEVVCFQNTLIRMRAKGGIDPRYLFWRLRSSHIGGMFRAIAAGTKIKHIGVSNTGKMKVKIHTKEHDRALVVSALDAIQVSIDILLEKRRQLEILKKQVTSHQLEAESDGSPSI